MSIKKKVSCGEYYEWLVDQVDDYDSCKYKVLMLYLWTKEFYSSIPMDENRASDGKELRSLYMDETDQTGTGVPEGPCRVLEVLVALSKRINDDILMEESGKRGTGKYFWEMLSNLGVDSRHSDAKITVARQNSEDGKSGMDDLEEKVTIWLDRKYKKTGFGGIFPLRYTRHDQRTTELWYQMHEYLNERYPI